MIIVHGFHSPFLQPILSATHPQPYHKKKRHSHFGEYRFINYFQTNDSQAIKTPMLTN